MKKFSLCLMMGFIFLMTGFWGCQRTPLGGFGLVLPPTATVTPGGTPVPTSTPAPTLVVTPYATPLADLAPGVIRNLTQWQAAYGATAAPVDFNQQMILQVRVWFPGCWGGGESLDNVCWNNTQITVSMINEQQSPGSPTCNITAPTSTELVAVPQSNLPVVEEIVGYTGGGLLIPFPFSPIPTPTATP
jgi:hypothetical protein